MAVAIGEDANKSVLAEFTGSMEAVITTRRPQELRKWIRFVSVTSVGIGSQNRHTPSDVSYTGDDWEEMWGNIDIEPESKQSQFISEIKEAGAEDLADDGDSFIDDEIVW